MFETGLYMDQETGRKRHAVFCKGSGVWYFPRRYGRAAAIALCRRLNNPPAPPKPREYRGVFIYRNTEPGRLRWYTVSPRLAADTLAGIKQLIKDSQ